LKNINQLTMKLFRLFLILLATNFLFTACEKDASFEAGIARGAVVKDALGDCLDLVAIGTYKKSVPLTTANTVDVQVIMSEPGSYIITTDTVNGYSFSDVGVATAGLNILRLKGNGTPIAVGIDQFKVKFDGTVCNFFVSVSNAPATTGAVFTFTGSPGTCTGATQNAAATFMQGIATNPTNWVDVAVNVTVAGTYSLNTGAAAVNGVKYSGSGTLALGNQTVRLIAVAGGNPTIAETSNYQITGGASNCGFSVVYQSQVAGATFTINCGTALAEGDYIVGAALNPILNFITVPVTVTAAGSYNITATALTTSNGVTFSGSGILALGAQMITLYASATTPAAVGTFVYNVVGGGTTTPCPVPVSYIVLPVAGTGFIKANIDGGAFTNFNNGIAVSYASGTTSEIQFEGTTSTGEDFVLYIEKPGTFTAGVSYDVTQTLTGVLMRADYNPDATTTFEASSFAVFATDPFKIKFTTVSATNITGTFSGTMQEDGLGGNPIRVFTNGSFNINF
jgi:hypothetical protein